MWRRWIVRVAAALAVPAALALVIVAVDVLRVPGQLQGDDARFQATPKRQQGLWDGLGFVPGGVARRVLGVDDDVAYRRTVALYVKVDPGRPNEAFGPEAENLRGRAQREVTQRSAEDANPRRRSILLNLLATMTLGQYSTDPVERDNILRRGIQTLRSAIEVDPGNDDAKLNLELALRNAKATNLPGTDPDAGAAQGSLSGQGRVSEGGY